MVSNARSLAFKAVDMIQSMNYEFVLLSYRQIWAKLVSSSSSTRL
jgi:hypothetical protein